MARPRFEPKRWAEVFAGLIVIAAAGWWLNNSFGLSRIAGWLGLGLGAALIWVGIQRLLFGSHGGGLGVVQLDERRLTYFGPLTGGTIDLDDLVRLEYDGTARPPHWVMTARGAQMLAVPIDAEGADLLFDAFTALPGISSTRLAQASAARNRDRTTLWHI